MNGFFKIGRSQQRRFEAVDGGGDRVAALQDLWYKIVFCSSKPWSVGGDRYPTNTDTVKSGQRLVETLRAEKLVETSRFALGTGVLLRRAVMRSSNTAITLHTT